MRPCDEKVPPRIPRQEPVWASAGLNVSMVEAVRREGPPEIPRKSRPGIWEASTCRWPRPWDEKSSREVSLRRRAERGGSINRTLDHGRAYARPDRTIVVRRVSYPDCRDETIKALQSALNLGMASNFKLHTPLMWSTRPRPELARELGGAGLVDLIREHSHTCYLGDRGAPHDWGFGCGECPACSLRAKGWREYVGRSDGMR